MTITYGSLIDDAAALAELKRHPTDQWIAEIRSRYHVESCVDKVLTAKLKIRWAPPYRAQTADRIATLLQAFIGKRIPTPFELSDVQALTGGGSKEQFRFRLRWDDPDTGPQDKVYVLRMQPCESIVETDRQREFDVLRGLQGRIPVPEVLWCDPEGLEFGQPALIMAFVEGVTKPASEMLEATSASPKQGFNAHYRQLLGPKFLRIIADVHSFDWRAADIPSLGTATEGTNEALLLQIDWWRRVWEEDCVEPYPLVTYVGHWLTEHAPPIDRVSIVHGDFRAGNFLFDPDSGEITAMIDWELAHLGDRHEDLSYTMAPLFSNRDESGALLVNGLWERDDFVSGYQRLSGLTVDPERLNYYRIFNGWRCAIISLGSALRVVLGQRNHQNLLSGWYVGTGTLMAQQMLDAMHEYITRRAE
jgi:aminoglycoside phosphotransferase (APT) family kinase protein